MAALTPLERVRFVKRRIPGAALALSAVLILGGCRSAGLKRPVGWFRLGPVNELQAPETYFADIKILLRHDDRGYSAMSTACTFDLSALIRRQEGGHDRWVSNYTDSSYDESGHVVSGPAKADLPYYTLKLDSGSYDGPKDTLYVEVGVEQSKDWRLQIK